MTLVLICGCLEPGADGVGDYSRRLAGALLEAGVKTYLLALHDPFVSQPSLGVQTTDGHAIEVCRFPSTSSWSCRGAWVRDQLRLWQCDTISLQFVPYAYGPKGLPYNLVGLFRDLLAQADYCVHLMFHEIWIGVNTSSDLRSRCLGHLQRRLIQLLYAVTKPVLVHTTNGAYAACLRRAGLAVSSLPLFSNLACASGAGSSESPLHASSYSACIFGRIPPRWDPDPALAFLVAAADREALPPRLVCLGRHWASGSWFSALRQRWPQVECVQQGEISSVDQLSMLIRECRLGLATVPWSLIEKSGAVAAFLSLGLPVLVTRDDWRLRRRWSGGQRVDLPDHLNLFRLRALTDGQPDPHWPTYVPLTPQDVAHALMNDLQAVSPSACSS